MTVTSCTEIDLEGERSYTTSLESGTVGKRTFIAYSNSTSETETSVISGAQVLGVVPLPFELFPGSPYGRCHSLSAVRQFKDRHHWKITAEYKSMFSQTEKDRATYVDPTERPTRITSQSRTIMIPVRTMLRTPAYKLFTSSLNFTLVTASNSAGDPLDPPVEMPSTQWELHCQKDMGYLPNWFLNTAYQNGVNANDQLITICGTSYVLPAGYAKLSNLNLSELKYENEITYVTLSWNVTFQMPRQKATGETAVPGPFDVERLDEGMRTRVKKGVGGSPSTYWQNVKDFTGSQSVTSPVPFDGSGSPLKSDGSGIAETELYRYCYRPFGPRVDFSVIQWT